MMTQRIKPHKRKPRGDTRFPGICRHARLLGVDRSGLYRALTGVPGWELPGLVERYNALLAEEGREPVTVPFKSNP